MDFFLILTRDTKTAQSARLIIHISSFCHPRTDQNNYGNFGLYDQVNALKWVYDEIHHFGGGQGSLLRDQCSDKRPTVGPPIPNKDNSKITIFGWSAGSRSVGAHMISELGIIGLV